MCGRPGVYRMSGGVAFACQHYWWVWCTQYWSRAEIAGGEHNWDVADGWQRVFEVVGGQDTGIVQW